MLSFETVRSSWMQRMSSSAAPAAKGTKAEPSASDGVAETGVDYLDVGSWAVTDWRDAGHTEASMAGEQRGFVVYGSPT